MERQPDTYLRIPCSLDGKGECGYKAVSVLGCEKNDKVKCPWDCVHYRQIVNIGMHEPKDK